MIKVVKCFSIFVLIDTWWNVNTNKLGAGVEEVSVLIDTWWNVNEDIEVKKKSDIEF